MSLSKINRLICTPQSIPFEAQLLASMHQTSFAMPWTDKSFAELLRLPTTVAWMSDEGFLLCSYTFDEMEILTICSMPDYRRQGVAKALLAQMLAYAHNQNVKKVFLEVAKDNEPAKALYASVGFEQNGVRKNYYKTPGGFVDALCFVKNI